jgi:hypothetical protein
MAHPLRRQILRVMHASAVSVSTTGIERRLAPSGLASESIGNLAHHVRSLAAHKVIRHVRQRQVRGAIEHFYASSVEEVPWLEEILSGARESDETWLRSKEERQSRHKPTDERA